MSDAVAQVGKVAMSALGKLERTMDALAAKDAEIARLREALGTSHAAMAEYYRYFTGGETKGSYDGKPERSNLWKAMYAARAVLESPAK